MKLTKNEQSTIILQSNKLIEAKQHFTLTQKRLFIYVLTKVNRNARRFKLERFTVKELAEACKLKGESAYTQIKEACDTLLKTTIEITDGKRTLKGNVFASVIYDAGTLYIELSYVLTPFLLLLKEQFTAYEAQEALQLRSLYSIRIYELLKQYKQTGVRIETIDKLKYMLNAEHYEYKALKRIIKRAQSELKDVLPFEFAEQRNGRKVTALKFYMQKQIK